MLRRKHGTNFSGKYSFPEKFCTTFLSAEMGQNFSGDLYYRPPFKYTRIEVSFILNRIARGKSIETIVDTYADSHLTRSAIQEAMLLANSAFMLDNTHRQRAHTF